MLYTNTKKEKLIKIFKETLIMYNKIKDSHTIDIEATFQ